MESTSEGKGKVYAGGAFVCDVTYYFADFGNRREFTGNIVQQGSNANLIEYQGLQLHMDTGVIAHFMVVHGQPGAEWTIMVNQLEAALASPQPDNLTTPPALGAAATPA